jgi:hypothetical protein
MRTKIFGTQMNADAAQMNADMTLKGFVASLNAARHFRRVPAFICAASAFIRVPKTFACKNDNA